jgi:putative membrane protein
MKTPTDNASKKAPEGSCETSRHAKTFRAGGIIALIIGAAISTALIINHNVSSVLEAFGRVGWGFTLIFLIQISGFALNSFAWRALFRLERPGFIYTLLVLRWIRESINYLLPVARLGGEMVAVRLLAVRGRDVNTAIASIVVDKTLEFLGLFFFALPGIIFLSEHGGNGSIRHWAVQALGFLFVLLIVFLAAQRWGLLKVVDKLVKKFFGTCAGLYGSSAKNIHDMAWTMYADTSRVISAGFLHALAWTPGALQVWVALHFMGFTIGLPEAFVIECLAQVICAAAFIMPAALGAQEAAYMAIGWWLFGLPPEAGLAVSLVQRLKDVVFSIPGLLAWQGFEGRRLWKRWRERKN